MIPTMGEDVFAEEELVTICVIVSEQVFQKDDYKMNRIPLDRVMFTTTIKGAILK